MSKEYREATHAQVTMAIIVKIVCANTTHTTTNQQDYLSDHISRSNPVLTYQIL